MGELLLGQELSFAGINFDGRMGSPIVVWALDCAAVLICIVIQSCDTEVVALWK